MSAGAVKDVGISSVTFWTEPVKWIKGSEDLNAALDAIDKSFPKAK